MNSPHAAAADFNARVAPTIAVVDDDREMRDWLASVLRDAGYQVVVAANGLRLVSALQVDRPELILLDVVMSWIDGVELCRALKANPDFRNIPVMFVSGRTADTDVQRGLDAGAIGYLPKPVDRETLLAQVSDLLQPTAS